jgi:saccharopine dehydrogenase-like NADP-dependent oxidoreductase
MINEQEIKKIQDKLESDDSISEELDELLPELAKLKKESEKNLLKLAERYLKIFNFLKERINFFKDSKSIYDEINKHEIDKRLLDDLIKAESKTTGGYFAGERVKKYVAENRKSINNLIDLFSSMFKEND